jgi:hypothetical protein
MAKEIEKIEKVTRGAEFDIKPEKISQPPNAEYFEELMRQRSVNTDVAVMEQSGAKPSLEDAVRELSQKTHNLTRATPLELAKHSEDIIAQIDTLKSKLQTPDLDLRSGMQNVLKDKLNHIDENLKVALEKAGLEYVPPDLQKNGLATPIERFVGLLTHGQTQLETLTKDIKTMRDKGAEINPADMLLIQVKVTHVQQEIELFTSMLNKALESTKTVMNVQV